MTCRICGIQILKDGYCDESCFAAHLIQESIPVLEKLIIENDANIQEAKENLKECTDENWIDFHKHMLKSEFAEKLFHTALLKRESRQTLTRLRDEFLKALEKTFNIMFEDDEIKQTLPDVFYGISCTLKSDVRDKTFSSWIKVFSKVD
jgi:hypothetical protein